MCTIWKSILFKHFLLLIIISTFHLLFLQWLTWLRLIYVNSGEFIGNTTGKYWCLLNRLVTIYVAENGHIKAVTRFCSTVFCMAPQQCKLLNFIDSRRCNSSWTIYLTCWSEGGETLPWEDIISSISSAEISHGRSHESGWVLLHQVDRLLPHKRTEETWRGTGRRGWRCAGWYHQGYPQEALHKKICP